jgi:hypothetical protein
MASTLALLALRNNTTELTLALDNYEQWFNASQALATSESYEMMSSTGAKRRLTRANASEVEGMLIFWDKKVQSAQAEELGNDISSVKFYEGQTRC